MPTLIIDYIQEIRKAQQKAETEIETLLKLLFKKEKLTKPEVLNYLGLRPYSHSITLRAKRLDTYRKITKALKELWLKDLIIQERKKGYNRQHYLNPKVKEEYKALKTLIAFLENLDKRQINLSQEEKLYLNKALSILKELLEPLEEGDNGGENPK